jgi:hypothetical protein
MNTNIVCNGIKNWLIITGTSSPCTDFLFLFIYSSGHISDADMKQKVIVMSIHGQD